MDVNYNLPNEGGGSSPQPSTSGAVRYDCEQSLTEEQKAQARENIGALPEVKTINITGLASARTVQFSQNELEEMGITAELMEAAMAGKMIIHVTCDDAKIENDVISMEPFAIPEAMGEYYALKGSTSCISLYDNTMKGVFVIFFYVRKDIAFGEAIDDYFEHVQSDWNETDTSDPAFIKNKPTIPQPENHQIVRNALASSQTYEPNEWVEVCRIEIPEDGAYQISSLVKPVKVGTVDGATINVALRQKHNSDVTELAEIELQPNRVTGCMARAINALRGDILVIESYSTVQYGIQAQPSVGKAHATYLEAVRIGAIYSE